MQTPLRLLEYNLSLCVYYSIKTNSILNFLARNQIPPSFMKNSLPHMFCEWGNAWHRKVIPGVITCMAYICRWPACSVLPLSICERSIWPDWIVCCKLYVVCTFFEAEMFIVNWSALTVFCDSWTSCSSYDVELYVSICSNASDCCSSYSIKLLQLGK